MKNRFKKAHMIIIVVCVIIGVVAFRAVSSEGAGEASYHLLYEVDGTAYNAYTQNKAGVKAYQYIQSMQMFGDILGNDRTADLHDIEEPNDAKADVVVDLRNLDLSYDVKEQFNDLHEKLLEIITESFEGSPEVKAEIVDEVNNRIERINSGDLSYLIPLDSYLVLSNIRYDENQKNNIKSAKLDTFIFKKKDNITIVDGVADLSEKNMTSAVLVNKDLKGTSFEKSWLNQGVLAECSIIEGDFSDSLLIGTLLVGCDLRESDLSGTDMSGAVIIGSDLSGANLKGAMFKGTEFRSLGDKKVRIDKKWEKDVVSGNVRGIENIEWI
jgi:uncharacterized protein YjbI with pentapeptide repeats